MSSAFVLTFVPASDCFTTNMALLRKYLQQWGLLHLPRLRQGRPSASTSDGSVSQLLTIDSRLMTLDFKVKARVTSWLAVYHQSVHLGAKPLETRDQFFFTTEPLRSESLCNILSDEKVGLSLMNMLGLSSSVRIRHIACSWKFFLLHYVQFLCQYRLCKADHAYLSILCYNGSVVPLGIHEDCLTRCHWRAAWERADLAV
jgi:hypothetical protein